jgi:hypothetical protein
VNYLKFRIGKDFQETGKCRVHIGKPIKGYGFSGLILRKKSLRRNSLNQGYRFTHSHFFFFNTTSISHFLESWSCTKLDLLHIGAMNIRLVKPHLAKLQRKISRNNSDAWTFKIWPVPFLSLVLGFLCHSLLSWPNSFDVWRPKWSN